MTHPQATLPAETGHWWALALRGATAILFGLAALLRPEIAVEALILLFGAYALVDGVFSIVGVFGGTRGGTPRWLLLIEGVAGILAGLIAFALLGLTAFLLLYLIAAWAIVIGISEIAMPIILRKEISGEWAVIVGGAFSCALRGDPGRGRACGRVALALMADRDLRRGVRDHAPDRGLQAAQRGERQRRQA